MLRKIVLQISPKASMAKIIALSQCFMKDMSTHQDESEIRQKLYVKWLNYIKEKTEPYHISISHFLCHCITDSFLPIDIQLV
jgi:hypothetical protein